MGRGVARLVEAGLLSVAASRRDTGSDYTATSAAFVSSPRTRGFDEVRMERRRLIGPGEEQGGEGSGVQRQW